MHSYQKYLCIVAILALCIIAGCKGETGTHKGETQESGPLKGMFLAMGGVPVEITLYDSPTVDMDRVVDLCREEVLRLEMILNRYKPESEISKVNRLKPGTPLKISPELREVLEAAGKIHTLTGGKFDPTVTPLIQLWKKAGKEGKLPSPETVQAVKEQVGFSNIQISDDTLTLKKSVKLDLGAIAKGFIVDKLVEFLLKRGEKTGIVNAGGDLRVFGTKENGFSVGIMDPFRERTVRPALIKRAVITEGSFVTSGNYIQFSVIDGKRYTHIIDPVSGYPVDNSLASVSIAHEKAMIADGLATGVFVLGFESGAEVIKQSEGVGGYLLGAEKQEFKHNIDVK